MQDYSRLNQVGVCVSTLQKTFSILDEISKQHTAPLSKCINTNTPFSLAFEGLRTRLVVKVTALHFRIANDSIGGFLNQEIFLWPRTEKRQC